MNTLDKICASLMTISLIGWIYHHDYWFWGFLLVGMIWVFDEVSGGQEKKIKLERR